MFAIVDIAGFQEKVAQGDTLEVPRIVSKDGQKLTLDRVLLVVNGDNITFGMPLLSGATVEAEILGNTRGEKIRVVKAHKRKRYRRVHGHRQQMMKIQIGKISV
ncbi:50S ribosomal protein L21 [Candidatus Peregrinibacteria bacterium]|nr:50S ribosomal protein L21 [Candidatus Peregrinibacteria bacterium]